MSEQEHLYRQAVDLFWRLIQTEKYDDRIHRITQKARIRFQRREQVVKNNRKAGYFNEYLSTNTGR